MTTSSDHRSLLIGATGMLAPAIIHVAPRSSHILSLARHAAQFKCPTPLPTNLYNGHDVDYESLAKVKQLLDEHGPFNTALTWIRPKALTLRELVAHHVITGGHLVEVMGSAASRPGALADQRRADMAAFPDVTYSQLILGFIPSNSTITASRWLTHAEISSAACRLLDSPCPRTIVGQIEPWDSRPS